jgi:hypothetical protein
MGAEPIIIPEENPPVFQPSWALKAYRFLVFACGY